MLSLRPPPFPPLAESFLWEGAQCSKGHAHSLPYYYCIRCDELLCDTCWDKQKKHRTLYSGHDMTAPNDAIILYSTLNHRLDTWPLLEHATKRWRAPKLRQMDDNSEWFGVRRKNEAGDYSLVEGRAYDLMVDSFSASASHVSPRLVSFVGETGSGKSTLISLLSKFSDPFSMNHFKIPVVGDSGNLQPTSSNVHLYADPGTFRTKLPILYAECEGMDGDETPAEIKKSLACASASSDPLPPAAQIPELNSQDIIWSKVPRNAGAWTRKAIARVLFPRILYPFSDVVVFPFSRIRHSDSIFQLVKWGHDATMQSYNKPALPSAIIVFINRDGDDQVDPLEYALSNATRSFFERSRLGKELHPYIQYWEANGKHINSTKELLSCYYSSVSVVHLPSVQCPTPMLDQIKKLYDRINVAHSGPRRLLYRAYLTWNPPTFPLFVRKAFTHFASKYETPFDFSDAWVDVQNFSPDFNRSIFYLARMARGHRDLSLAGMTLWIDMSGFVASCLFLRCVRAKQTDCKVAENVWRQFEEVTEKYWRKFWPCEYRMQTPDGYQQCVNAPSGHPHHQGGKAVEPGDHLARHFPTELRNEFCLLVERTFDELKSRLKHIRDSHERLKEASMIHLRQTRSFYKLIGGIGKLVSHFPCLICLDGVPEHSLPCGHVICRECAKAAGDSTPGGFVTLRMCPLQNHWEEDWPKGRTEH